MQVLEPVLRVPVWGISWARECRICGLLTLDSKTGDPIFKPILHVNFNIDSFIISFIPELAIWILKDWFTPGIPGVKKHSNFLEASDVPNQNRLSLKLF